MRLADAQNRHRQAIQHLEAVKAERANAEDRLFANALMEQGERWLLEQYVKGLKGDEQAATLQERTLAQLVEESRTFLAARAIDRKMLDKLKERQRNNYRRNEQMQEQHFNDEIATLRYKAPAL